MRFNPKAKLDPSQIDDRTGGGGGGGGFGGGGGGMRLPMGGGIGGLIFAIVLIVIFGGNVLNSSTDSVGTSDGSGGTSSGDFDNCTAAQANSDQKCRLVAVTNSVQAFWATEFPKETGKRYVPIQTVPFTGSVQTRGCGNATSAVGPFYCPNDQRVYLDLGFFKEMLQGQLGAKGGSFAEAYVVAHEYGHHIQNLLGIMGRVRTQQGEGSDSVKLELMADCLAGAWAKHATTTPDSTGQTFISDLTQKDIANGIDAAAAVGDDRIQKRSGGRVNPETWTHGSSQQRIAAFDNGLKAGTLKACNTFD